MDYGADFAAFYDEHWRDFGDQVAPRVLAWANDRGLLGKTVLDLCCGTGASSQPFVEAGWNVVGVDLSAAMVQRAQQHNAGQRNAQYHVADITNLPTSRLPTADLTICLYDSLNHLPDMEAVESALRGAAVATRAGGRLLFDVNTELALQGWADWRHIIDDSNGTLAASGSCDHEHQTAQLKIIGYRPDGERYRRFETTQTERAFSDQQLTTALARAGWDDVQRVSYRDLTSPITLTGQERRIVYTARRTDQVK